MSIKHNKKKNTAIVYDQLMTLMTNLMTENKEQEFFAVKDMVLKHFNKSSNILREKKLFDSLMNFKHQDLKMAERFLDEVLVESSLIDVEKIELEKVNLINEIMKDIGVELFRIPVKNYKLHASAQFLLNEMRNNLKHSSPEERLKLKLMLVENIQKQPIVEEVGPVDRLTFKILKNKYVKKYSSVLNDNQQQILAKYNDYLMNNHPSFIGFINEQYKSINKEINSFIKKNPKYENMELLKEAKEKTTNISLKEVSEENIYETMRYWDVVEDLNLSLKEVQDNV